MKIGLFLLMCLLSLARVEAGGNEAWYEYRSNNYCEPVYSPSRCYSTACYGEADCGCSTCTMLPVDHIDLGYTFGEGIDTRKNYLTANLMQFPDCQVAGKVPFYSLIVHHLSNKKWAGSVGTGLRWRPFRDCFIYGFNVFYDIINAEKGVYNQVGAGFEYLSKSWEWRINGYLPVGTKSHRKIVKVFDRYEGPFFVKVQKIEQTSHGADLEVGRNFYYCDKLRFYAGLGPAWFERSYTGTSQWAFEARAYLQWCRYLTIEIKTFKESSESWHCQGVATLSVPFDCLTSFYCCGFSDLFSQPVSRNAMIKKSKGCCWQTNY